LQAWPPAGLRGVRLKGAGRPRSALTVRTQEVARRVLADGVTPLDVMLQAMRAHLDAGELDKAAAIAKDAAPYVHPRLQAVQHSRPAIEPAQVRAVNLPIEEIEQIIAKVANMI
jgi:hypothetical protein